MGWRRGAWCAQPGGWLKWWFSLERKLSHEVALSGQHRSPLIHEALEAHLSRRARERAEAILLAAANALAEDPTAREEALAAAADFLSAENEALAWAEVGKVRPVVVIQADLLTAAELGTWLVLPLTSQRRQGAEALRVPIRAWDRLGDGPLTALSAVEMAALEEALRGVMGF